MRGNKKILGGVLVVVIMLFGLSFLVNQKVIFAEESNVFYFDELSVGDYIPNGATIIVGQDYYHGSGDYINRVEIHYLDDGEYYASPENIDGIGANSSYAIKTYETLFENVDDGYSGWEIEQVWENKIELSPSTLGVVEIASPSENNDYTLELDGDIDEIKWYKYENLEEISTDSDNSLWTKDGDTWILRNFDVSTNTVKAPVGYKEKVTFDFNGGEKVYFGTKYTFYDYYGDNRLSGTLDENSIFNIGSSSIYERKIIDLADSEKHSLTFEYEQKNDSSSYFHLDAMVLTDLNQSEATLDTTDLQDGDKVFYMAKSGTQTFKGKLVVKKEGEPIPDTADSILNYIILGIISISAIGLCIGYSKKANI